MEKLIKSCNERDLNGVIRFFNQEKYPCNEYLQGSIILENVIINQDIEILKILLNNKIVFNEDILNALPYSNEEIFMMCYEYITRNIKNLNMNFKNKPDFLIDLCKSFSSTEKMFSLSLKSNYFDINYKDLSGRKLIHTIVCLGKHGFLKHLKDYEIDYMEIDDKGYTVFDYAMKKKYESMIYELIVLEPVLKSLFKKEYGQIASSLLYK